MPARPLRVKLKNELGIRTSLPAGEQYLELLGSGRDTLVLFPGPDPILCASRLPRTGKIFHLRLPELEAQLPETWHAAVPDSWQPVCVAEAAALLPQVCVLHYTPLLRLVPSVIAPLLARLKTVSDRKTAQEIWLPGPPNALLIPELARAARQLGLTPRLLPAALSPRDLETVLRDRVPGLFLSLNFHGLDPYGENQALLQAAGSKLAVWCVDNPFHILTSQKNTLWQRVPLFVTDDWFIPHLRKLGADSRHLPLGTDPTVFAPTGVCPDSTDLTFVGRSRFPDRDRFFAACRVPEDVMREAEMQPGRQAHFGWWRDRLDTALWPGNSVRTAGLGAERMTEQWRADCLNAAARETALTIIGDTAWDTLVTGHTLRPPVDYFSALAGCYRQSSFTLNLTSLLLPRGLTQRHFDVWACGGFLLTDTTPGLHLFPHDLTKDISFDSPRQIVPLLRQLSADKEHKESLRASWQQHILGHHTYVHRLRNLLSQL